ncbi:RRP15-like protein [Myxocyprinus asiaticus]|uniref:RRP15-like protein n=1 Tax=Myxocyprinus asiaticus TaxID=70543 RepID=UPI002222A51B|nr:RRP15-like protein [Myxocyprinus asiaticus]
MMATLIDKPHVTVEDENEEDCEDSDDGVIEHEESGAGSDQEGPDEDSDGEKEEEQIGETEENTNPNAGWAEAMAKILGKKTPESKPSILLKNKELDKIKDMKKKERLEEKKLIDKKRAWENMCREKPDVVRDRDNERSLQRIATRGVVQLFNAVKKHQKSVDQKMKDVGGSERKKAKILSSVSKKDFIDVLRGANSPAIKKEKKETARMKVENPAWSVLRDDFMMSASMKDWDKETDEEAGGGDQVPDEGCSSESD